jgi:hypothetical protein
MFENRHADRVKMLRMFSLNSFFCSRLWRAGLARAQRAAQSLHGGSEAREVVSWDASVASQRRLADAAEREKKNNSPMGLSPRKQFLLMMKGTEAKGSGCQCGGVHLVYLAHFNNGQEEEEEEEEEEE